MPRFPSGYSFPLVGMGLALEISWKTCECPRLCAQPRAQFKGFEDGQNGVARESHGSNSAEVIVGGATGSKPSEQFLRSLMHQCFRSAPTTSICIDRCSLKEKELRRSGREGIQTAADVVHFRTNLRSKGWNSGLRIGRMSATFRQRHL